MINLDSVIQFNVDIYLDIKNCTFIGIKANPDILERIKPDLMETAKYYDIMGFIKDGSFELYTWRLNANQKALGYLISKHFTDRGYETRVIEN